MNYVQEILDRKTGELVSVDQGDWITITELSCMLVVGRRRATTILRHMGFLQVEGGGRNSRHRIADWVVEKGWGKRLHRKGDKFPFDVIGPNAIPWIKERWQAASVAVEHGDNTGLVAEARDAVTTFKASRDGREPSVQMLVCWLADFFPSLTQQQMGAVLDVTQQLVCRFLSVRSAQHAEAKELRKRDFERSIVEPSSCMTVA